jgi:hypothetical protein
MKAYYGIPFNEEVNNLYARYFKGKPVYHVRNHHSSASTIIMFSVHPLISSVSQ